MAVSDEEFARQALERAAATAPPMSLDVDRQLALGARRRRARRWGTGTVAVACVAVLAVGVTGAVEGRLPWGVPAVGGTAAGGGQWPGGGTPTPSAAPSPTATPLTERELLDAFDVPTSEEDLTAQVRAYQEAVAACMQGAGFQYVPNAPDHVSNDPGPTPDEQWYATWGYGISIDTTAAYPDAEANAFPDPNADYVASLSPAERKAYDAALEGTGKKGDLGCYVSSYDEVPAEATPGPPDLVAQLQDEVFVTMAQRLGTDPRMADAVSTLARCASDAGATDYDPYDTAGVTVGLGDQTFPVPYAPWDAYGQVEAAWEELTAAGAPSAADLAQFQQWERDTAVAAYRCDQGPLAVRNEIETEVLHEVVGPHRAELEALLAAAATTPAATPAATAPAATTPADSPPTP